MGDYTSTQEGFQRAMEWSLTGAPEDATAYAETITTPEFYQIVNGHRLEHETYVQSLVDWRGKTSDYLPVVKEFLRDGDRLAAYMTGTIKVDGTPNFFESFMFAKTNAEGKMEWLIEHANWGPTKE